MFYIKKCVSRNGVADCEVAAEFNTYIKALQWMNNLKDSCRVSNNEYIVDGRLWYISTDKE